MKFSYFTNREFLIPPLETLKNYKFIACTCSMAGKLYNLGIPKGHFDLVIIDEAG